MVKNRPIAPNGSRDSEVNAVRKKIEKSRLYFTLVAKLGIISEMSNVLQNENDAYNVENRTF